MGVFSIHFVSRLTVHAFTVFAAVLRGLMKLEAVGTIKVKVATIAWQGGSAESVIVKARLWSVAVTGPTGLAFAWMVRCVIGVEALVAEVAPVTAIGEACE